MQIKLSHRILQCIIVIFLVLTSFVLVAPRSASSQTVETGYWVYQYPDTPKSTWVGTNFRGFEATWEPVYTNEYTIGGIYQEINTIFNKDNTKVWLTEKATCTWTWNADMPGSQLDALNAIQVTVSVEAFAEGPGTVMSGGIASINYGSPGGGMKTLAFTQANIDKLSANAAYASNNASTTFTVPPGSNEGEQMALELVCKIGNGMGTVSTRWIYQWKIERTALPQEEPTLVPTLTATTETQPDQPVPTACPALTRNEKYIRILGEYHRKIPNGIHPFGVTNNIVSVYSSNLDKFTCGAYQRQVLALLDSIRFNTNPCIAALMDDFDYGPIQAFYGGHQAVVLYPRGGDWITNGIVLDPWIRQTAKAYSMDSWSALMSAGLSLAGKNPGIGPSNVYTDGYPTHGTTYRDPSVSGKLTTSEKKYVSSLDKDKRDQLYAMGAEGMKAYLDRVRQRKARGRRVVAHCPLEFYVQDAQGLRTGMVDGAYLAEIPDILFSRFPLEDGTFWTQIEYDPDLELNLVMQGTGKGTADLFIGISQFNEDPTQDTSEAFHLDVASQQVFNLAVVPDAAVDTEGGQITPVSMDEATAAEIASKLSQPQLSLLKEITEGETNQPSSQTRTYLLIGGLCCLGALGAAAVTVLVVFLVRRKR